MFIVGEEQRLAAPGIGEGARQEHRAAEESLPLQQGVGDLLREVPLGGQEEAQGQA